mgnify:CR=1 FL=1
MEENRTDEREEVLDSRESDLNERELNLNSRESDLSYHESELNSRESDLDDREAELDNNEIDIGNRERLMLSSTEREDVLASIRAYQAELCLLQSVTLSPTRAAYIKGALSLLSRVRVIINDDQTRSLATYPSIAAEALCF